MRWMVGLIVGLMWLGCAEAQNYWVGANAGTSWTFSRASGGKDRLIHNSKVTPGVFVAFSLNEDTNFRVSAANLAHTMEFVGLEVPTTIRAYTIGIDYFLPGTFGKTVFSGGLGSYEAKADWRSYRIDEKAKFGYYLGVGEWFDLTRRSRVTAELTYHGTETAGHPRVLTFNLGVTFGF